MTAIARVENRAPLVRASQLQCVEPHLWIAAFWTNLLDSGLGYLIASGQRADCRSFRSQRRRERIGLGRGHDGVRRGI